MRKEGIAKRGEKNKTTIRKILNYISKYKGMVLASVILAAISVVFTLYIPILIGQAVDQIVGPGQVNASALFVILKKILVVSLITAGVQWMKNHINNRVTYYVVEDIRTKAFNHIQVLPISYLDSHPSGDIVSRIITDTDQFSEGLLMGFTQLFTGVTTIIGTLLFMLSINPVITLVVVAVTPLSFFVARFIAGKTFTMFKCQSETRGAITALTDEMLGNLKVVKAFSHEQEAQKEFEEINERLAGYSMKATFFSSIVNPATRFVNSIVYAAVGVIGALFAVKGFITVGQLTSFLNYANQYTKPFNEISGVVTELQNSIASASRVFELIEQPALKEETGDSCVLGDAQGYVDMQHVAFSYEADKKLIEDLNLHAEPGQRIAIVGPTGCGKSTLINLLMRFYEVNSGTIKIDSMDTRKITRESLRAGFGMVLQETWLKSSTVRENIAYGKPDATEEEIIRAAKEAHCDSFIRRMPEGYDTVLGEDGGMLSQGQKQLLCIARVMLCLPPMLILDEATSSIDTRTEQKIQNAFAKMMEGRTSFIVAHRLSTIKEADVILVMKDGNIIEQGTHQELLAQNGFYTQLYNAQFAR
ncbi:ABC transporter ATP-binding protein/permease [Dorea acetigenes]|uniref:ABC transporter ATP-binding protein/permease n=1 Tax=Dorea acetigenes TaxID=2981787 RepID=A0ABT2RIX9_9FIRM|nr:ABC transporter ATP-binding protein [Dorea acetigenes]MCU6685364.1 ABC transporter ATP-binding protein/permease [Dorea acetigenes]SCI45049.1 Putative multidrug export ATP-binding/permease protein SAV1866 [uncultured Clostridium sp.]